MFRKQVQELNRDSGLLMTELMRCSTELLDRALSSYELSATAMACRLRCFFFVLCCNIQKVARNHQKGPVKHNNGLDILYFVNNYVAHITLSYINHYDIRL